MKTIFNLILIIYSYNLYAKGLSCSESGTDLYYVNGILTNSSKNTKDAAQIQELFKFKNEQIDVQKNIKFIGIHNPSFGAVNDAAELFAQAYYIKTGKTDNAKTIYNVVKNLPAASLQEKNLHDPNGYFSSLARFTSLENLNYVTLTKIAEESDKVATERSMASVDTLVNENNVVSAKIRLHLIASRFANRKVLVVAHSQGNAVVNSAFRQISDYADSSGSREEINYLSKYGGVFHVASPVAPLTSPFKSRSIRSKQDKMIDVAQRLGLPAASITHEVVSRTTSDFSGHLFFDTYLSPDVLVRPINSIATPVKMSDVFVNNLSDLATDLESNCSGLNVNLSMDSSFIKDEAKSSTLNLIYKYKSPTYPTNEAIFNVSDLGDFGSDTVFKIYQNGALVETKIGKIKLPSPGSFSTYFTAYNPKTLGSGTYTVTVNVTENLPPKMIGGWKAACQGGGIYSGNIANGNLLRFYADFQDDSPNDFDIVDSDGSGRGFSQNLLYTSATSYVTRIEFNNQENEEFTLTDTNGASIKIRTPTNPCVAGEPMPTYD